MCERPEDQIVGAEEKLRLAMLSSDVSALNELLAPDLIFTNHLGQRLSKMDDLEAHHSGALMVSVLEPSDQHINFATDKVAIVSVRVHIVGEYAGEPAGGDFRFTRVWVQTETGNWQVVAAHAGVVV